MLFQIHNKRARLQYGNYKVFQRPWVVPQVTRGEQRATTSRFIVLTSTQLYRPYPVI